MKHFSLSWLINQEEYCDRSLLNRAVRWLLQRALPETKYPKREKKAQHPMPISLRTDHTMLSLSCRRAQSCVCNSHSAEPSTPTPAPLARNCQ